MTMITTNTVTKRKKEVSSMIYSIFNFIFKPKFTFLVGTIIFLLSACDTDLRELDKKLDKINKKIEENVGDIDSLINKKIEKVDSLFKDKIDSVLIK